MNYAACHPQIDGRGVLDTDVFVQHWHTFGLDLERWNTLMWSHPPSRGYANSLHAAFDALGLPAKWSGLWCIDFEHYPPLGSGCVRIWTTLLSVIRERLPAAMITAYNLPRNQGYVRDPWRFAWHDAMGPMLRKLDLLSPCMYLANVHLADWRTQADAVLAECRRIAPRLPIAGWLMPVYLPGNVGYELSNTPIPGEQFAAMVDHLRQRDARLILWENSTRDDNGHRGLSPDELQGYVDRVVVPAIRATQPSGKIPS
jgi:hypothetical protein